VSEDNQGHLVMAMSAASIKSSPGGFHELMFNGTAIRPVNALYRDTDGLLWMGLNGGGLRCWTARRLLPT
jgi:hypothetical protein